MQQQPSTSYLKPEISIPDSSLLSHFKCHSGKIRLSSAICKNSMAINVTSEPDSVEMFKLLAVSLYPFITLLRSAATGSTSPKDTQRKRGTSLRRLYPAAWPRTIRDSTQEDTVIVYTPSVVLHHKIPFLGRLIKQETNLIFHTPVK